MGVSKLKLPKICEHCGKAFEAKTVNTRFCSDACNNASLRLRKKQALEEERKKQILQESKAAIAEIQTRPYISITEAVILFGISKDTIRRLIKAGKIPAINLGQRLTRISRAHIEAMFTAVALPEQKPQEQQAVKLQYEPSECYTIGEVSEKYGVSLSTVSNIIRRNSIPKREVGKFVYVPKEMIDKILAKK
ncbi:MAG: helix-turn-helix domain-containing protein [Dysgonamonadaceae bacterium]|jgi:excisionase family DNA binding protein|nr:helix-turn-helix domain-containing protein [Dysgonamonadaceae bacterium]